MGTVTDQNASELLWIEEAAISMEAAVAVGDYGSALVKMVEVLEKNHAHSSGGSLPDLSFLRVRDLDHIVTRFVSTSFNIFFQEKIYIPDDFILRLVSQSATFHFLVSLTPYRDSNHLVKALLAASGEEATKNTIYKLAFLWSPYSDIRMPWAELYKVYPRIISEVVLQGLSYFLYATERAELAVTELVDLVASGEVSLELTPENLGKFVQVWMFLSYKSSPCKRHARGALNQSIQAHLKKLEIPELVPKFSKRLDKGKPKCAVLVEVMNKKHAMYRAIGPYISSLRKHFQVIGIGVSGRVDKDSQNLFDGYIEIDKTDVSDAVRKVTAIGPDLFIFSSVGMSWMGPLLVNLRFAPLQLVLPGHCDLTVSSAVDYFVVSPKAVGDEEGLFGEKLMKMDHLYWEDIAKEFDSRRVALLKKERSQERIDIAIPCALMKLSYEFVRTLRILESTSEKSVRFHFFPSANKLYVHHLSKCLEESLTEFRVYPYTDYESYLANLAKCHLALDPFPYSNGNGNVDLTKVGIPIVALKSDPICGYQDTLILNEVGAPPEFVQASLQGYIDQACKLINDEGYRESMEEKFVQDSKLMEVFDKRESSVFGDLAYETLLQVSSGVGGVEQRQSVKVAVNK